jgi:DUF971 family protein
MRQFIEIKKCELSFWKIRNDDNNLIMQPKKIKLEKENKKLNIDWDDFSSSSVKLSVLRKNCPCAECITERMHRPPNYIPLLSSVSYTIKNIEQVGTYAVKIYWQDGHDTGIYPYTLLKDLSE